MHLSVCVCVCVVAVAVMVVFPSSLTEEEEALQKKYAKLKKKVRDCHTPEYQQSIRTSE